MKNNFTFEKMEHFLKLTHSARFRQIFKILHTRTLSIVSCRKR